MGKGTPLFKAKRAPVTVIFISRVKLTCLTTV